MPPVSSIDRLPPEIRAEIDAAIKRGLTIDDITAAVRALGAEVSRSAIGRYSKNLASIAAHQRNLNSMAEAFGSQFGDPDDKQVRLLIQLLTSIMTRAIIPIASGDEIELTPKQIAELTRGLKDLASAAKLDIEREAKIREEERKKATAKAAEAAERGARASGASPETIERIKAEILGIAA